MRGVFDSVAGKYDLMNDLMSGGLHRLWKRFALLQTGLRPGQRALDVAAGTGDLGAGLARQVGPARACRAHRHQPRDARARPRPPARCGPVCEQRRLRDRQCRVPALPGSQLRLRDDRLRAAQRHRQAGRARLDAPRAAPRRAPAGARVLEAAGRAAASRSTTRSRSRCCRGSAASSPRTRRATATSPNRSACTRTRRRCAAMMKDAGFEDCRWHNLAGGIVALHVGCVY